MTNTHEINLWKEIESRQVLTSLVFDSTPSLAHLIKRVDLRDIGGKKACVIVFTHKCGIQEWKLKEKEILEQMRRLYKERNLKEKCVFYKVLVEEDYKPIKKEGNKPNKQTYEERATGEFRILCKEPSFVEIFKNIQGIIKERKKETQ